MDSKIIIYKDMSSFKSIYIFIVASFFIFVDSQSSFSKRLRYLQRKMIFLTIFWVYIQRIYDSAQRFVLPILSTCSTASHALSCNFSISSTPAPVSTRVCFAFFPQYFFTFLRESTICSTIHLFVSVIIEFALYRPPREKPRRKKRTYLRNVPRECFAFEKLREKEE